MGLRRRTICTSVIKTAARMGYLSLPHRFRQLDHTSVPVTHEPTASTQVLAAPHSAILLHVTLSPQEALSCNTPRDGSVHIHVLKQAGYASRWHYESRWHCGRITGIHTTIPLVSVTQCCTGNALTQLH